MTYDTDNSLFQIVQVPGIANGCFEITEWFAMNSVAHGRLMGHLTTIGDVLDLPDLTTMKAANPNYKYIGVVCNPWARVANLYDTLATATAFQKTKIPNYSHLNLTSLSSFVAQMVSYDRTLWPFWWTFTTNQQSWVSGCDYIVRSEHLTSDFAAIQAFFKSEKALVADPNIVIVPYASRYDTATKNTVATMFKTDIDQYNYTF